MTGREGPNWRAARRPPDLHRTHPDGCRSQVDDGTSPIATGVTCGFQPTVGMSPDGIHATEVDTRLTPSLYRAHGGEFCGYRIGYSRFQLAGRSVEVEPRVTDGVHECVAVNQSNHRLQQRASDTFTTSATQRNNRAVCQVEQTRSHHRCDSGSWLSS